MCDRTAAAAAAERNKLKLWGWRRGTRFLEKEPARATLDQGGPEHAPRGSAGAQTCTAV